MTAQRKPLATCVRHFPLKTLTIAFRPVAFARFCPLSSTSFNSISSTKYLCDLNDTRGTPYSGTRTAEYAHSAEL